MPVTGHNPGGQVGVHVIMVRVEGGGSGARWREVWGSRWPCSPLAGQVRQSQNIGTYPNPTLPAA